MAQRGSTQGSVDSYTVKAGTRFRIRWRDETHAARAIRGFMTEGEAKRELRKRLVIVDQGASLDATGARAKISTWVNGTTQHRSDLSPSSRERMEGIVKTHIVPALGGKTVGALRHSDVQRWANELSKTQGPSSVRKIVNVLSGSLEVAVKDRLIASNPARGLKLPKVVTGSKRYLSHEQVRDLADAVEARAPGRRYGLLVRVLAYSGLRWSELSGLRVMDVDPARGRLEVRHTVTEAGGVQHEGAPKSYEARSVPLPAVLMSELAEVVQGREAAAPAFPGSRRDGWLRNRVFRRGAFDDAATEVGLEGLTPHELRHTAASLAIGAGANVKLVQRMLGHASAAVTLDIYSDLFDSDIDTVSDRLNQRVLPSIVSTLVSTND